MVGPGASNLQRNRILAALSNADLALLQPHLERVPLKMRQRLHWPNRQIRNVYFPESGIASVVAVSASEQRQAEIGIVGREGMTGLPIVLSADRSPCDTFIEVEGEGQCISTPKLRQAMDESATILKCFLRYAHVFAVQTAYTALANARGNIEERLARWLLMTHDRMDGDKLGLTHEFISLMLGVRRAGVTSALQGFEAKGLIERARSTVVIKDRAGLEEAANGLYGPPEAEFKRLFA
jgi:CRP-like cAMP-binding protein